MRAQRHILPLLLIVVISLPVVAQRDHGRKGGTGFAPAPKPQPQRQQQRQPERTPPPHLNQPSNTSPQPGGAAQSGQPLHGPGPHNGDWLRRFGNLPPQDQEKKLQNDPNFQKLPRDRQQKLMQRLDNFNQMSPDQKQRVLNRMEMLEHMTPEQRDRTRQLFQQFRQMDPDSRQRINMAVRRLHGMPPDARQNVYNSPGFKSNFNEQEQNVIKGLSELGPADAQPPESPDR